MFGRVKNAIQMLWIWIKGLFSVKKENHIERFATMKLFEHIEAKKAVRLATLTVFAFAFVVCVGYVGVAAAETNGTVSVNWTSIGDLISGVASIFPSFIDLVSGAVPVIIFMGVIGFVLGFMDEILGMIRRIGGR